MFEEGEITPFGKDIIISFKLCDEHRLLKREDILSKGITRIHTSSKNRSKRKEQILGQHNRD